MYLSARVARTATGTMISTSRYGIRNQQEAVVPKCSDIVFLYRRFQHGRAGIDFITQCPRPQLQQAKSQCDKNACCETFRVELQLCGGPAFALSHRKAFDLVNPVEPRCRPTTFAQLC